MKVKSLLFDTRSIQRYIFSGNRLRTNIGASYIVDHLFDEVLAKLPAGRIVVTESGILAPDDVDLMRSREVGAFLVGEAFMRMPSPGQALASLFFA